MEKMNSGACANCPVLHNAKNRIIELEKESDENIMTCMGDQPEQQAKVLFAEAQDPSVQSIYSGMSIEEICHMLREELAEAIQEYTTEINDIRDHMGRFAVSCTGPLVFHRKKDNGQHIGIITCDSDANEPAEGIEPVYVIRQNSAFTNEE